MKTYRLAELEKINERLLTALKLSRQYLAKIVADSLLEDCVLKPDTVLTIIDNAIKKAEAKNEDN